MRLDPLGCRPTVPNRPRPPAGRLRYRRLRYRRHLRTFLRLASEQRALRRIGVPGSIDRHRPVGPPTSAHRWRRPIRLPRPFAEYRCLPLRSRRRLGHRQHRCHRQQHRRRQPPRTLRRLPLRRIQPPAYCLRPPLRRSLFPGRRPRSLARLQRSVCRRPVRLTCPRRDPIHRLPAARPGPVRLLRAVGNRRRSAAARTRRVIVLRTTSPFLLAGTSRTRRSRSASSPWPGGGTRAMAIDRWDRDFCPRRKPVGFRPRTVDRWFGRCSR